MKKPQLSAEADKENIDSRYASDEIAVPIKGIPVLDDVPVPDVAATGVASTIKEEEAFEPLLQENPGRFVLFPIKYHEVGTSASEARQPRVKWLHIPTAR